MKLLNQKEKNLEQSFDDETEVVMVMSQQPVIIPGQDRYIMRDQPRMIPVGIPIAQKTSGLRGLYKCQTGLHHHP